MAYTGKYLKKTVLQTGYSSLTKRKMGEDGHFMSSDIHIYRWFSCFLKIAKELEDNQTLFELNGKKYPIRIDRTHPWYNKINVDKFPKDIKLIQFQKEGITYQIKKLFDNYFWKEYRNLFQEPKSYLVTERDKVNTNLYDLIAVPKHFSFKERLYDFRNLYRNIKQPISKSRSKTNTRHMADIVIENARDLVLKRLFHTMRLEFSREEESKKTNKKLTGFDICNEVRFICYGIKKIDVISVKTFDRYKKTNKDKLEALQRATYRDIKWGKYLILNLCKGHFPIYDKIL
jgi:hypothetical protein